MNILYGVQGTGNGHISRSREVIRCLKEKGHHVEVLISGRDPKSLWDMEDFEPFSTYRGLTFATSNGKINYARTALKLDLPQFFYDIHAYKTNSPDLVITDFEPITARIAKKNKISSIGIGHQYAFWHDIPAKNGNPLARFILKNYAPADIPIGLHWNHFNQPILPPIVPLTLKSTHNTNPSKVLVYLPFEELTDILNLVHPFDDYDFYIYHKLQEAEDNHHLHLRPFSRSEFLQDLEECTYVICSAGFELISEALSIGKNILVKPLEGQMEQYSNALALEQLHLGMTMNTLDQETMNNFLTSGYSRKVEYPDVAEIIVQWLEFGHWHDVDSLVDVCWRKVNKYIPKELKTHN